MLGDTRVILWRVTDFTVRYRLLPKSVCTFELRVEASEAGQGQQHRITVFGPDVRNKPSSRGECPPRPRLKKLLL